MLLSLLTSGLILSPLQHIYAQSGDTGKLPLISFSSVTYKGGFRLPTGKFGSGDYSSHSHSPGSIAYNPENHSLFTVSHSYEQGIGEFAIPDISSSRNYSDFNTATVLQNFQSFHQDGSSLTGIDSNFLITGLTLAKNKLLVNFINWYDAGGQETDTTVVIQSPNNLAETEIIGPFQLNGAAHASGWLTPIPPEWQAELGGDYIAGHSHGSIVSRLSIGPPAHVLDVDDLTSATSSRPIATNPVLDFDLAKPLYDKSLYDLTTTPYSDIAYNTDGNNSLWTIISGASYGFIVPNTRTYMTLGYAGGFYSRIGYKITQADGNVCGGPCSYDPDDNYNHYWLWNVDDLVKVKNGELLANDVRPYEYGQFETLGNKARIKGAAYDDQTNQLYISLQSGDRIPIYDRPPLILVYTIDPKVPTTSITVDGKPTIDRARDNGWYIWRENGQWISELVAGGSSYVYEGGVNSSSALTGVMPTSLESSDVFNFSGDEISVELLVTGPWFDRFRFDVNQQAHHCVTLDSPGDINIYLGPNRIEMPRSFDLNTLGACQSEPVIATLGKPIIDRTADKGIFLWKRATNDWSAEVVTGDTSASIIDIDVLSQQLLSNVVPIGIEPSDIFTVLPQQLDLNLRVKAPWSDGFKFSTQLQSGTCVSTPTVGMPIYLGPDRVEVGSSMNLDTLASCQ